MPKVISFEEKVNKVTHHYTISESGCWEWKGPFQHKSGYGRLYINPSFILYPHRVSYEHYIGSIPKGMRVCHRCDNPKCINPDHLFVGTDADNVNDKVSKKRQTYGMNHPSTKIPTEIVEQIQSGELKVSRDLAEQLLGHRDSSHLYAIKNRKHRKDG